MRPTVVSPATAKSAVGAMARPTGDAVTTELNEPNPPVVTAAIRNDIGTPALRLPTVNAVAAVPVLATTVVHDAPPFELRSMR